MKYKHSLLSVNVIYIHVHLYRNYYYVCKSVRHDLYDGIWIIFKILYITEHAQ